MKSNASPTARGRINLPKLDSNHSINKPPTNLSSQRQNIGSSHSNYRKRMQNQLGNQSTLSDTRRDLGNTTFLPR